MRFIRLGLIALPAIFVQFQPLVSAHAAPVKVNGSVPASTFEPGFRLSPDGSHVLYYIDQETPSIVDLYIAPVAGGSPVKLNGATGGLRYLLDAPFTPDGSHVLYIADEGTPNEFNLYIVPGSGGPALQLNGPISIDPSVVELSHDGDRVLYAADQDLFVVETSGDDTVEFNLPIPQFGGSGFAGSRFSPDDSKVLIVGSLDTADIPELYIVPAEGGTPLKLNGLLAQDASIDGRDVQFTPTGSHVVFAAEPSTLGKFELFSVPAAGGTPVKLNGTMTPGGSIDTDFLISPDGNDVVYVADQDTDGETELYITSVAGGTPLKLNGPLWPGGDVDDDGLQFSPDGSHILFVPVVSGAGIQELFIVPRTGGTPIKLNGPLAPGGDVIATVRGIQFTQDGSQVLYVADQDTDGVTELYVVSATGGVPIKLNSALPSGGDIRSDIHQSPDGKRLVYWGDQDTDQVNEIYIVPIAGGTPVKLSGTLGEGEDTEFPIFTPDGSRVLYRVYDSSFNGDIYSRVVRQHMAGAAGLWHTAATWEHGETPDEVMHIVLNTPAVVTATGSSGPQIANMIDLGGGAATSTLVLETGATLTSVNRFAIHDNGVLRGDGQLNADLVVADGGEIRVAAGDRLHISGNTLVNSGRIEAIGTSLDQAEIEFDTAVVNGASTGLITAAHSHLQFDEGLTNNGELTITDGQNHVFGEINNTGKIVVSAGASVTFNGNLVQNGVLTISKVGNTSSSATFLGDVSGSGTLDGGGDVVLEGNLSPGNSPGTISFENNILLGDETTVEIEIGGMSAGVNFDTIEVDGALSLNGVLSVVLIDAGSGAYLPEGGSQFEIVSATDNISGTFDDEQLPGPRGGVSWDIAYGSQSLTLHVSGVRGDYNYDSIVDASDYAVWRRLFGTGNPMADGSGDGLVNSADFDVWRSHFGQPAIGGTALDHSASVPEPASCILLAVCAFVIAGQTRRRR